jgi:FemAB-related protein (PEP-CTERM system-associated)
MEVLPLTTDLEDAWQRFVEASPQATFAHLLGWRSVVTRAYHHTPCYLVAREAGQVGGVLPLFLIRSRLFGRLLVTAPYLSHGGLLAASDEAAGALIEEALEIARRERARYVELRSCQRLGHRLILQNKYCTFLLPLARDPEALWGRLEQRGRTAVRKAIQSELKVEKGHHLLGVFDAVLSLHKRELGTPFHRETFYRHILEEFPDRSEILMVRRGQEYLGGGLFVTFKDTILALYGGALAQGRAASVMSFLYWEAIRHGCEHGLKWLDFGRSERGSGTALFKRQWRAESVPMFYEYHLADRTKMPDMSPTNPRFRLAIATWKRLPLCLTRFLGPWIIRDIP